MTRKYFFYFYKELGIIKNGKEKKGKKRDFFLGNWKYFYESGRKVSKRSSILENLELAKSLRKPIKNLTEEKKQVF